MPAIIKGLKNNQKIRVILNEVAFNTTVKNAFNIIATANHRVALSIFLSKIAHEKLSFCAGNYGLNNIQVNLIQE
jgi:L-fucose mutarotase/ribose pyranase (RbsD/FucU family)